MTSVVVPQLSERRGRNAAALLAVWAVYLITVASMATVGVVVPQMAQLSRDLDASMAELGFAIGLYSLPAALFSMPLGLLIDRLGVKLALLLAAACALCADVQIFRSDTLPALRIGLAVAGVANAVIITSAPALLMTALSGQLQVRAVSLWSTYGPAGYALGLLIGAPFADGANWRIAILCLMVILIAATVVAALIQPNPGRAATSAPRPSLRKALSLFADGSIVRVSAAYGIVAGLSYGSSLATPRFLASVYGVSMAASATAIAVSKIVAMLLGGVSMGWLLSGYRHGRWMFVGVCLFGLLAQGMLFFPGSGMVIATAAMILWLFAYGAISAISFVTLARVNRDPAQAGIASGLIGQLSSLTCFAAPAIYFAVEAWSSYVLIAAACLATAALLFPITSRSTAVD